MMPPITIALNILFQLLGLVPGLTIAYTKIVDSLHRDGELTDAEWEARKAEYRAVMGSDAWTPDP